MNEPTFTQRHYETISKLKVALIVVCLIAIPATFYINHHDVGSVGSRVTKIESPCERYGAKSEQCKEAFEQAVLTITHAEACAILRKAGLQILNCAHARLKQERRRHQERAVTKGGGALQQPSSTAHQPPEPPSGGSPGKQPDQPGSGGAPVPPNPGSGGGQGREAPAPTPATNSPAPSEEPAPEQEAVPAAHPLHETLEDVATTVHQAVCTLPVALCP